MAKVWHVGGEDVHMRIPLLQQLASRGLNVGAVGRGCESHFAAAEIEYHEIDLERGIDPIADVRVVRALRSLMRTHTPEIVHGFDTKPSIFTPLAARGIGSTRAVRTINGMGNLFSENTATTRALRPAYRIAQRFVRNHSDHIVFQNEDDFSYFTDHALAHAASSTLIRGSGISMEAFRTPAGAEEVRQFKSQFSLRTEWPTVTLVARLVKNKGVPEFLTAARALRQAGVEVNFLLVGPLKSEGSQAVEQAMLDEHADVVAVAGRQSNIPLVLSATDLFVLPSSYREGVPRSLLEAAAFGLPLIASDMPGCRDVVEEGNNGRLVPIRNEEILSLTIREMLEDLPAWQHRAKANVSTIGSRFGLSRVAEEHFELYTKLLAGAH